MMSKKLVVFSTLIIMAFGAAAQNWGTFSGNIQLDAQYYMEDSAIGAPKVKEQILSNGFAEIKYNKDNFNAGIRYEMYLDPLNGFDAQYKGNGIPYYYANYTNDAIDVTLGHFYEQFGSGLILRSYEDRTLGLDNSLNGLRVRYMPAKGVTLTGLIGNQRFYWEKYGLIRGFDADFSLNDMIKPLNDKEFRTTFGASFVSKFEDKEIYLVNGYPLNFPENVAAAAGRVNFNYKGFGLSSEYAHKINDPNTLNNYIFRPGQALLVSGSYTTKGLGIIVQAKRIDNMSYKSKRSQTGDMLSINYLPALTRQHTYALPAIYPYATQPNGEMAMQADITYTIPKKSTLGGKYGTEIRANFSAVNSIDKTMTPEETVNPQGTYGYESKFFKVGDEKYYRDFNIGINKKINASWKVNAEYIYLEYNKAVILNEPGEKTVYASIAIADVTYKINKTNALRLEAQHLWTKQDEGNWIEGMIEYSIAPHWFISFSDMYNYGETDLNYFMISAAYVKGANRFQLGYGKNRAGVNCAGGVCKYLPASNGLSISIVSSF